MEGQWVEVAGGAALREEFEVREGGVDGVGARGVVKRGEVGGAGGCRGFAGVGG